MMRVLYVTNGLRYGGAERIVEALAIGVKQRGGEVEVVATTRDGPIGDVLRQQGINVHVLGISSPIDLRVVPKLIKIAHRFSPEVVHSHLAVADIVTAFAKPFLKDTRLVTTVHNSGIELDGIKQTLWRGALRRFDNVIAVGDAVKRSLPRELPIQIIHPSLISTGEPRLTKAEARAKLFVASATKLVLAIGRLTKIKGFDVLAEAAEHVTAGDVRFMVIGEGEEEASLQNTKLELIGAREDASSLLSAADVVVCPSRSEGFPQVPLHAMAAAVPIIATHVGGMAEVVRDGVTGVLVPPEDPKALALAIDALLSDRDRAEKLGKNGPKHLEEAGLTKQAMIERTLALY